MLGLPIPVGATACLHQPVCRAAQGRGGLNGERPAEVVSREKVETALASLAERRVERPVGVVADEGQLVEHADACLARLSSRNHPAVRLHHQCARVGVQGSDRRRDDSRSAEARIERAGGPVPREPERPVGGPGDDDSAARGEGERVRDFLAGVLRHDDPVQAEGPVEPAVREVADEREVRGVRVVVVGGSGDENPAVCEQHHGRRFVPERWISEQRVDDPARAEARIESSVDL